jgi:hypothetical protein
MNYMENIIKEILSTPKFDGCVVEYYPHVIRQYETGGFIKNETELVFNPPNIPTRTEKMVEYIHREKKLVVYESGDREYLSVQQKFNQLCDGSPNSATYDGTGKMENSALVIVSKVDCIDPNKFPMLNKYYDICRKTVTIFDDKYITISIISENNIDGESQFTYIKISFLIHNNEQYKRGVLRHFREVVSLLPRN